VGRLARRQEVKARVAVATRPESAAAPETAAARLAAAVARVMREAVGVGEGLVLAALVGVVTAALLAAAPVQVVRLREEAGKGDPATRRVRCPGAPIDGSV
jgi:hypothetical protein